MRKEGQKNEGKEGGKRKNERGNPFDYSSFTGA